MDETTDGTVTLTCTIAVVSEELLQLVMVMVVVGFVTWLQIAVT